MKPNSLNLLFSFVLLFFFSCNLGDKIEGCIDEQALNYSSVATKDDGSCIYEHAMPELPQGFSKNTYQEIFQLVYGGSKNYEDEMVSGIVTDNQGNTYFSLNTNNSAGNHSLLVGRIGNEGELDWAKEWQGPYSNESPDAGGNGETGGVSNSITLDESGNLIVVGQLSDVSQNNIFSFIILKISSLSGEILWNKSWKHNWPSGTVVASMDARAYSVTGKNGYIYVTGSNGENEVPVIALSQDNGDLLFEMTLEIEDGVADKGFAIQADAQNNLYLSGSNGSYAFLSKITGVNTSSPIVEWTKKVEIGYGAQINSMDVDATGIYLSCNRRGVSTFFSMIKVDADGNLLWGKTFPGSSSDNNTIHCVRSFGNHLYAGGVIGQTGFTGGLFLKMNKSDGALAWSGIYYTGQLPEEEAEHRVKGIWVQGDEVYIGGQVYGGNNNMDRYHGYWINNGAQLEDYSPWITPMLDPEVSIPMNGGLRSPAGSWQTASSDYTLQTAMQKTTAAPPDAEFFLTKIKLF